MSETAVSAQIALALSSVPGVVTFRNNVGAVKSEDGRFVRFGLCPGSSDRIGWVSVVVTPDMVGKRVAVFLGVEAKTPGGRTDPKRLADQTNFIGRVLEAGGFAGFASSPEQALRIIGHGGDHSPSGEGGAGRIAPRGKPKHGAGANDPGD